jgi:RNA polymerase sigma-70 factor (ECF subfamily)
MPPEVSFEADDETRTLVDLVMAGDRTAVDQLFASHLPQLRRAATWVLQNPYDSEDAVQDGLLLAYRKLDQFQGRSKFSTWLHAIVVNAARTKLRRRRARPTTPLYQEPGSENAVNMAEFLVDPRPNPEEEFMAGERTHILSRALETMPDKFRTVIHLMDIEGYAGKQSAQKLGITLSALKARHFRARRSILEKTQKEMNAET